MKVILQHPYPYDPGYIATRRDDKEIEIWSVSETYRKYRMVGKLDNLFNVTWDTGCREQINAWIAKHYWALKALTNEIPNQ